MKLTRSNYQSMDKFVAFLAIKFILNAPLEPLSKLNNVNDNLPMDKSFLNLCAGQIALPPPPGNPGDITFLGVAQVSLSLYFSLAPPYINTPITLFSSATPLFITHIFRLTSRLSRGAWGQNNLTGALRLFYV